LKVRTVEDIEAVSTQFVLCIIETKRLLASMDKLEYHISQVVAQSVAV
jgi:hypothetical protein